MTTELEAVLKAVDVLLRRDPLVGSAGEPSGGVTTVDRTALIRLRDARARHLRSTGVPSRMDIASRSISDDRPIVITDAGREALAQFNGA